MQRLSHLKKGKRDSEIQLENEDDDENAVAEFIAFAKEKYKEVKERLGFVEPEVSGEEKRVNDMAEIIRTYRGIPEEEEDESLKPWVDQPIFDVVMSVLIVLNTITIGLETDLQPEGESRMWYFYIFDGTFVLIFWIEIALKCRYHTRRWPIMSFMNFFCTVIACMAFLDLALFWPMQALGWIDSAGTLRMLSLLRIIGLMRLLRLIRQYRWLEELRLVIQGMLDSLQTIMWVVVLVIMFLYICAIVTTKVIGHDVETYGRYRKLSGGWDHEEMFGTIGRSMYTLLQVMTLDSWSSGVARHVIANQWWMSIFFLGFLLLSTHGLLNVVVSVIVEHTLTAAQSNEARMKVREERKRKQELEQLTTLFRMADEDQSGELTKDEFLNSCRNPRVHGGLMELGLPPADAARLFEAIEKEDKPLSIKEFIKGCTKVKGAAQSKDLLAIQAEADTLAGKMEQLSKSLGESERMMNALDEVTTRITRRFAPAIHGTRQKIAHSKGGSEPVVPPKRTRPGMQEDVDLSIGNRPALPTFPNLLA
jgi:voltage-gated sodium channel